MIENRAEIGRMMETTDPRYFNLCPDTGHLLAGGSDPLEVFRTYQSRIIYLHFKDWDPDMVTARTAQTGRKGGFPELGEGIVPLPQLAEFLVSIGYDKWVMIEIDSSRTTPLDSATKDLKYVTDRLKLKVG
jgi:inosose dehydratase